MPLASTDDVATRIGEIPLSETRLAMAGQLLEFADGVILDAVDKSEEWLDGLGEDVPPVLRGLAVELVARAMASPQGLAAASETLGSYSRSETYRRDLSTAMALTELEERLCRRAVYGRTAGSSTPRSLIDRVIDINEGRDPDEPAPAA